MAEPQERGEAIVDAVIARLQVPEDLDPIPAGLEDLVVDRIPLRPGEGTRIRVYPWEALPTLKSPSIASHALLLKIEMLRLIPDGLGADQALAPLYVWTIRRLLPLGTLGGLATKIEEGKRQWRAQEGEQSHALMLLEVLVTYQTRRDDPEART